MTFRRLLPAFLAILCLTGCPQASQFLGGGSESFNANKTATSREEKSGATEPGAADAPDATATPFNTIAKETPSAGADVPRDRTIPLPSGGDPLGGSGAQATDSGQQQSGQYMAMAGNPLGGGPGPIFQGPDGQDVQVAPPHPRLAYGENFSQKLTEDDVKITLNANDPFDLKLLMEEPVEVKTDEGKTDIVWVPEVNGAQIRAVYYPLGKRGCEAYPSLKYVDATVAMTADGSNVNFAGLHAKPGTIVFYLYKRETSSDGSWYLPFVSGLTPPSDFHGGDFVTFPDQAACEAVLSDPSGPAWVGVLQLTTITLYAPPPPSTPSMTAPAKTPLFY